MNINDILTLANAGFSKDEIVKLVDSGDSTTPKTTEENGAQNQTKEDTRTLEQTTASVSKETEEKIPPILTDAQVKQLAQALNIGNASIDVPPTISVDDKMAEHFSNLILGKE